MQAMTKNFFLCFFCLALIATAGCKGKEQTNETRQRAPTEQSNTNESVEHTETPPALTPGEQEKADEFIERYGKSSVMAEFLKDYRNEQKSWWKTNKDIDKERVLEYLKYFVSQGADVNAKTHEYNVTPLHWAVSIGDIEIVKFLVSKGADVHAKELTGSTPLFLAVPESGNVEIAQFLVSKGASVNVKDKEDVTPLHWAVGERNVNAVKFFVSQGADVHAEDVYGESPISEAMAAGDDTAAEIVKILNGTASTEIVKIPDPVVPEIPADALARMPCTENIQRIIIAIHTYHDAHGGWPPLYTVDTEGKPLHSWRMLLLPFVEEPELYDKIRWDEPWDSPHNSQFHDTAVSVYHCPSNPHIAGKMNCTYSTVAGAAFRPALPERGQTPRDSFSYWQDGTSNQIVVVEVKEPFCWMDPTADIDLEELVKGINKPEGRAGSFHVGGMNIGMGDGSVRFVEETVDSAILRAWGDPSDGMP